MLLGNPIVKFNFLFLYSSRWFQSLGRQKHSSCLTSVPSSPVRWELCTKHQQSYQSYLNPSDLSLSFTAWCLTFFCVLNLIVSLQVMSINPRFAKVHILYVGSTPLKDRFRGTIRYKCTNSNIHQISQITNKLSFIHILKAGSIVYIIISNRSKVFSLIC